MRMTFMKILTAIVVAHGMTMVTLSYVLSWFDKSPVEAVSTTLITEVVAPIIVYGVTKTIENVFRYNKLSFSEPIKDFLLRKKTMKEIEQEFGCSAE